MTRPIRLQLSRAKGFNLQAASLAANGLNAVNVARPSKWGNPYKVAPAVECQGVTISEITQERAVAAYRERITRAYDQWESTREAVAAELKGKNLACWCKPGDPCHADVLIELANRETSE